MRILHISLGLKSYRKGGLSKYSSDLMIEQARLGHEVYLLYPGHYRITKGIEIAYERCYSGIRVFELINPNLVPLLAGVLNPERILRKVPKDGYVEFLNNVKPEMIHFHTFMGIHKELLDAAKDCGVRTIFTTHDYYGLCPRVNLVDYSGSVCSDSDDYRKCVICNANGYDSKVIYAMQTKLYRKFKGNRLTENIKEYFMGMHRSKSGNSHKNDCAFIESGEDKYKEYERLQNYFMEMFRLIDYFHFNSSIAKSEYDNHLYVKGKIITISHSGISDNRIIRKFDGESKVLRIGFIGPAEVYKGFYLLLDSLNELREEGTLNWHLNIYGSRALKNLTYDTEFITFHGKYDHKDLKTIFRNMDILVVPSIGKETFGFVGLEAMSYGVPVLASQNAGLKDLIFHGKTGLLFKPEITSLKGILEQIINNRDILTTINANISKMDCLSDFSGHVNDILNYYCEILTGTVKEEKQEVKCLN